MLQETYLIILANIQFFSSDVMDVTVTVKTIFMTSVIPTGRFQSEAIVPSFFSWYICCRLTVADSLGINKYLRIQTFHIFIFLAFFNGKKLLYSLTVCAGVCIFLDPS